MRHGLLDRPDKSIQRQGRGQGRGAMFRDWARQVGSDLIGTESGAGKFALEFET
jgi:hypothetical protein